MLPKILLAVAAIVIVFLVVVALQSPDFRVVRTATIPAPPAVVFAQINDLHKWQAWSPWEKLDPAMKRTFDGPAAGVGAGYAWAGNKDVGEGRMSIVESQSNERVLMKLEFFKPFAATNAAEFLLKPEGAQTTVSWSMTGKKNFIQKAVCLFMNMDKMVGGQFEEGLANLKNVAAASPKK